MRQKVIKHIRRLQYAQAQRDGYGLNIVRGRMKAYLHRLLTADAHIRKYDVCLITLHHKFPFPCHVILEFTHSPIIVQHTQIIKECPLSAKVISSLSQEQADSSRRKSLFVQVPGIHTGGIYLHVLRPRNKNILTSQMCSQSCRACTPQKWISSQRNCSI